MTMIGILLQPIRQYDGLMVLVTLALVLWGWWLWIAGHPSGQSLRLLCLPAALTCLTVAVAAHAAYITFVVLNPKLNPGVAVCTSELGAAPMFFGTVGGALLAPVGQGPGRTLALVSAMMLVVLHVAMFY
jgi:hypothetical protein